MMKDSTTRDATQAAADHLVGAKRFRVEVAGSPSIEVPADDERQARVRYFEICGIRETSHTVGCELVSEPSPEPPSEPPVGGV